jgi:3-oxoacyl-[acyl-carrier protein] reductase
MGEGGRSLEGKVALVTGASRGIGREVALYLGRLGAHVAVNDVTRAEALGEVVAAIEALGGRGLAVVGDVSREADAQRIVAETETGLGGLDILVNNAGLTRDGLFVRMDEADWDLVLDVNLKGAFLMSKAAARGMMKRRSGSIVNLSSVVGRRGNAGQANYSAAKAGLIGLTKTLARELAPRNVRVNAVAPGYIETEMTAALPQDVRDGIAAATPLTRLGRPQDVAAAVAFLAGDEAGFVTGVVLPVDGGMGI